MPMDIRTYLGNRVQQARKACKLTQQELSDQTGVSIKMIQGIESGSVNPSYGILFPIVNRLGLTTSNLLNVEPDENEEEINRFLGKFRACSRAITPELEHRKSGYVERKRRPYQGNVVRIA